LDLSRTRSLRRRPGARCLRGRAAFAPPTRQRHRRALLERPIARAHARRRTFIGGRICADHVYTARLMRRAEKKRTLPEAGPARRLGMVVVSHGATGFAWTAPVNSSLR